MRLNARVCASAPASWRIGMVFQHFYLWPHMVALENVIEGLVTVKRMPVSEAAARGRALLEKVGLADHCGHVLSPTWPDTRAPPCFMAVA